jgi:hypothetical protein
MREHLEWAAATDRSSGRELTATPLPGTPLPG